MPTEQNDLFPVVPEIAGLGISEFKIKGGELRCVILGVTNTNDIALLGVECWQKAVAYWLLELHGGDEEEAINTFNKAALEFANRNVPAEGSQSRNSNVSFLQA
jgi:hypothetical protein